MHYNQESKEKSEIIKDVLEFCVYRNKMAGEHILDRRNSLKKGMKLYKDQVCCGNWVNQCGGDQAVYDARRGGVA